MDPHRSIHDHVRSDDGGPLARQGFAFQDRVAVRCCLEMLESDVITEVWCETYDDIVILRRTTELETVEFIQVKNEQPDQLWTLAMLCGRDGRKCGTSVFEKSLARDCFKETAMFRILTSQKVHSKIAPMTLPREHADRADAFGPKLAEEYDGVAADLIFSNSTEFTIERRWKMQGAKGKVFVDDSPMDADDFGDFILEKLEIPRIRFPKGNPYSDRTWPKLSWRSLFRSIYRQERFWSDFVDKQPEGEQAAALLQFLGVAEKQFPQSYEELVQKRKLLQKLEGQRAAYSDVLNSVTAELLEQSELTVAVTGESIARTKARIHDELEALGSERQNVLQQIASHRNIDDRSRFDSLRLERANVQKECEDLLLETAKIRKRVAELRNYKDSAEAERSRLKRTQTAGSHFFDFKVTHCPVCEHAVKEPEQESDTCYLCGNFYESADPATSNARIEFELDQLQEEIAELNQLIDKSSEDLRSKENSLEAQRTALLRMDADLAPAIHSAAEMLPPELSIIDVTIGRLNEQREQVARVEKNLITQAELERKIAENASEIERLSADQSLQGQGVDFRALSRVLEEGMNSYLNALNESGTQRWTKGKLSVTLNERTFYVSMGEASLASQVGATSKAIVLFSYHYALLKLSADPMRNYPGVVIIDFPLTLGEGERLADAENYLVEPFIKLCSSPTIRFVQFIAAGRAFANLEHTNEIKLSGPY